VTVERPYFAMPYQGIFRITCPTPFPGLPHVHVYMAEGSEGGIVVIDTAMPVDDSFEKILQGIEWMGRKPKDVERIYLTHAHPDHFGCAGLLEEATGAPVMCHPIARAGLERMTKPDVSRWERMAELYVEHGRTNEEVVPSQASSAFMQMKHPERFGEIEEGDVVTFAGGDWDIYWTPGHEEGHVVFHRKADGVLVVGDTVLGRITPHIGWMGEPADPLGQFLASLDKVAALDPTFVLPGHGRPFEEGAARARSIAAHHDLRLRRCLEILMRRGPCNAMDVARNLFDRDLFVFQERLALSETLSHLEYLRLRGRLHRELVDGIWLYEVHKLVP
jgi:glyoxylase-like metal-dependent hydrolase (beta-lactamase superfamily II)